MRFAKREDEASAELLICKSRLGGSLALPIDFASTRNIIMTATTGIDMPATIRKLARVYDDHQLEALVLDWAADCRGLTNDDSQFFTATELLRVRSVTNVLVQTCGFSAAEVEPMVRAVLLDHPRRTSALALINEYSRDANDFQTVQFDKLQHERERNART